MDKKGIRLAHLEQQRHEWQQLSRQSSRLRSDRSHVQVVPGAPCHLRPTDKTPPCEGGDRCSSHLGDTIKFYSEIAQWKSSCFTYSGSGVRVPPSEPQGDRSKVGSQSDTLKMTVQVSLTLPKFFERGAALVTTWEGR